MAEYSGRARRQSKDPLERYTTPPWVVDRLLEKIVLPPQPRRWLDPCAGDSTLLKTVAGHFPDDMFENWDIRPRHGTVAKLDFMAVRPARSWDVVIMNPPFSLTQMFVNRARLCAPLVICLGRLALAASEQRADWLRSLRPSLYVLPNRPGFTPDGKTDSSDYGWFVFNGRGELHWLDSTPKAERKSGQG